MVDLDLEGPGLHVIFGVSDADVHATINDVLQRSVPVSQAVLDLTSRVKLKDGCLVFCPAGHRLEEILQIIDTGFNLSTFKNVLEELGRTFRLDYLLIDSHPGIEKDTLLSMALCDYLDMVPSSVSEKESKKIADRLAHLFHLHVLTALPFNSDVLESLSKGVFVLERPRDPLTRRFTEVAMKMLEAIETGPPEDYSVGEPKSQTVA